jgi:hypothetical protein
MQGASGGDIHFPGCAYSTLSFKKDKWQKSAPKMPTQI